MSGQKESIAQTNGVQQDQPRPPSYSGGAVMDDTYIKGEFPDYAQAAHKRSSKNWNSACTTRALI